MLQIYYIRNPRSQEILNRYENFGKRMLMLGEHTFFEC
jgi:hypothetical protein